MDHPPHRDAATASGGEAPYRSLIGAMGDGIIVIDGKGLIQSFDAVCALLFGYAPEEVIGRRVDQFLHEPHDGRPTPYWSLDVLAGEPAAVGGCRRDMIGRRKDGSTFAVGLCIGKSQSGGAPVSIAIIRDLTGQKSVASLVEDANRLLAQIVSSSDDAILSKTLDGIITSWNGAAEGIFGYSAAEAIGTHFSFLTPGDRTDEDERILSVLRAGRDIRNFETFRRHKNGNRIAVSISVSPIRDASGVVFGASKTMRDISEKKHGEARVTLLQSELAHVARMSSMGQLSSAIAHELNQPLGAVANYISAAAKTLERPGADQAARAIAILGKAAKQTLRAAAIVNNLREFIRKGTNTRSPANLNDVIEEALALGLVGAAQRNVRLKLDLDPAIPLIPINKVQIQQVLINLISNGVEAMQDVDDRELTVASAFTGGFATVTVSDTGPGISLPVMARLFQPFMSTKEKGMGIGLSICQTILESHGGTIAALPPAHAGASFCFRLPLSQFDPLALPAPPPDFPPGGKAGSAARGPTAFFN